MKAYTRISIILTLLFLTLGLQAQIAEEIITESTIDSGDPNEIIQQQGSSIQPIDGVTEAQLMDNRMVMEYPHVREADVFWSKYIWGVIDVREKINQPFMYPTAPFFALLIEGIQSGSITPFMGDSDNFETEMDIQ